MKPLIDTNGRTGWKPRDRVWKLVDDVAYLRTRKAASGEAMGKPFRIGDALFAVVSMNMFTAAAAKVVP